MCTEHMYMYTVRTDEVGDLFVVFLLHEPWVISVNPEDVKVSSFIGIFFSRM